jgi:hypothetical protein
MIRKELLCNLEKHVHISWSFLFCSSGVGAWEGMEENIFVGTGSLRKVYRNVMLTYGDADVYYTLAYFMHL